MRVVVACALAVVVVATGCGGGDDESAKNVIHAGQVDIQLPAGWTVTSEGVKRPATSAPSDSETPAADGVAESSSDTVPLAEEDAQTKFFKALNSFSACLKDLGVKFIGVPDPANPDSPTNDPDYLANLGTCAAKSNIIQALEDQQKAQDAMTPAQIEEQNKGYLKWRDCMMERGWGIPEPKPDAKGRLFSFSADSPPDFEPPPGHDIISSPDIQECATEVQEAMNAESNG